MECEVHDVNKKVVDFIKIRIENLSIHIYFESNNNDYSLDDFCVHLINSNRNEEVHFQCEAFLFLLEWLRDLEKMNIAAVCQRNENKYRLFIKWKSDFKKYMIKYDEKIIHFDEIIAGELIKLGDNIPDSIFSHRLSISIGVNK